MAKYLFERSGPSGCTAAVLLTPQHLEITLSVTVRTDDPASIHPIGRISRFTPLHVAATPNNARCGTARSGELLCGLFTLTSNLD